jgi:hypothetical protein
MPRPKWHQVRQFCEAQGYTLVRGDHDRFLKRLADGSASRTKISHGADSLDVPGILWKDVWRRQLRLASEDEFWRGLDGAPVRYNIPPAPEPVAALPAYLVRFLRDVLHYTEEQIAVTDRAAAQALLNTWHAQALTDDEEA